MINVLFMIVKATYATELLYKGNLQQLNRKEWVLYLMHDVFVDLKYRCVQLATQGHPGIIRNKEGKK